MPLNSLFSRVGLAILLMVLMVSSSSWAQPCSGLPAERAVSDQRGGCLALLPMATPIQGHKILVALLHGDGEGLLLQRHIDRWSGIGRSLMAPDRNVVFVIRPGYHSPVGNSSGWANPQDDDYTAENMSRVAGALTVLKSSLKAEKLILVGHSGGAATAALVLGKHPGVVDAALLLGCPCDVPPWRAHRSEQRGRNAAWVKSLNPLQFVSGIPASTPVIAATGSQDDNTLPEFARRWVEHAASKGANARFEEAAGRDHSTILQWPEIQHRVNELVKEMYPSARIDR